MKRYSTTQSGPRYDGKQVYKTTSYPTIVPLNSDLLIISNETDYLDSLSYRYYNDPTLFWIIALANNLGKGRLSVPAGLTLRIPMNVNEIINEMSRLNSK